MLLDYQEEHPAVRSQTSLQEKYLNVRSQSPGLCEKLSEEDMTVQSMPDASPAKWHLAHTTWFFETFILIPILGSEPFNAKFQQLFNSYYVSMGEAYSRPQRGLITRPSVGEVMDYRNWVDEQMLALITSGRAPSDLVEVGLHHEMQHQELLLTDILHLFSHNPLNPQAMVTTRPPAASSLNGQTRSIPVPGWVEFAPEQTKVGAPRDKYFSYDCEQPRHTTYLHPYQLASKLVTNAEWLEFMRDGGYTKTLLWLSDGWAQRQKNQWLSPAYWQKKDEEWMQFGLDGLKKVNLNAPVCHVSYYEAQAFATWAGKRLPLEHELEFAMGTRQLQGNFVENRLWRPQPALDEGLQQLYGDVWEWTDSAFSPYPGFQARQGALGEYNGKFMCNQFVLKGGSCATPKNQLRASYRNFFYPHQRWQFTGLRLASNSHQETI